MGCWNGTCGISNLTITVGEPVLLILLAPGDAAEFDENPARGTYTSQDLWRVAFPPLRGKYDGYGGVEAIPSDAYSEHVLSLLRAWVVSQDMGKNEVHEPAVNPSDLTDWSVVGSLLGDSRILVSPPPEHKRDAPGKPQQIGFTLVREDIFETLANAPVRDGGERPVDPTVFPTKAAKWVEENFRRFGAPDPDWDRLARVLDSETLEAMRQAVTVLETLSLPFVFGRSYDNLLSRACREILIGMMRRGLKPIDEAREIGRFTHVALHMEYLRRHWIPQPGGGSQGLNWSSHQILAQKVVEITSAKLKAQGEEAD